MVWWICMKGNCQTIDECLSQTKTWWFHMIHDLFLALFFFDDYPKAHLRDDVSPPSTGAMDWRLGNQRALPGGDGTALPGFADPVCSGAGSSWHTSSGFTVGAFMIAANILVEFELGIFLGNYLHIITFWVWDISQHFFQLCLVETRKIYIWRVSLWSSALPPPLERQKDGSAGKRRSQQCVDANSWPKTMRGYLEVLIWETCFLRKNPVQYHCQKIPKTSIILQVWTSNFWGQLWNLQKKNN